MADPPNNDAAAVEAARAAASAQTASEAAAAALVQADVVAASATQNAEERMSAYEGRLNEWSTRTETSLGELRAELEQSESYRLQTNQALESLSQQLSLIQQRLEPPPEPPPNQNPGPKADGPKPEQEAPPKEEPPLPRKKAHRWI